MANKTVDRKKGVPARSQAVKASPKNVSAKTTRPSATASARPTDGKLEKSAVLEVEQVEGEEQLVEEEEETDEEGVEVVEEEDEEEVVEEDEEEVVEEKPAKASAAKARKGRDLVTTSPQDYSLASRTTGSRIPNFPGSQFLRASIRELQLVTWPSRHDTWTWSVVVVSVCIAVAVLLGATDLGLTQFVNWWISLAH